MNRPFIVDIDLRKNQLLNAAIQNLAVAPTNPAAGQIYYDTVDETVKVYAAGNPDSQGGWLDLGDIYTHPSFSAVNPGLGGANVLATLTTDSEGHVTAATTRVLTLADLGFTGDPDANNYVHPSYAARDSGSLTGVQVISRVTSDASGHITALDTRDITNADINSIIINDSLSSSSIYTWSIDKILNFVASAISGQMVYIGGYNANTNVPNLTTAPVGIKIGYTYTVTTAGLFFTEEVQVGDMIIAEKDDPVALTDWTVVNKNIPDIVDASTAEKGIIQLATEAEALTGGDATKAITPATLAAVIAAFDISDAYAESFGDGAAQVFTITHNLNSEDVLIMVRERSSGIRVEVQEVITDADTVTLSTNSIPTLDFYRVTIKK